MGRQSLNYIFQDRKSDAKKAWKTGWVVTISVKESTRAVVGARRRGQGSAVLNSIRSRRLGVN